MQRTNVQILISSLLILLMPLHSPAAAVIGVATANGPFQVNSAAVTGQATLFAGSVVETARASLQMQLSNGNRVVVAPESRTSVFSERVILEKGEAQVRLAQGTVLQAGKFRIEPSSAGEARLSLLASNGARISALEGAFSITNAQGVVLANLAAGNSLELTQSGNSQAAKVSGKLQKIDGKYFIKDETTNATVEVRGQGLDKLVGQRVEASGVQTGNVLTATSVSASAKGAAAAGAAVAGGTKGAVIAGVVIVSAVGTGLGVGLTRRDEKKPTTSR